MKVPIAVNVLQGLFQKLCPVFWEWKKTLADAKVMPLFSGTAAVVLPSTRTLCIVIPDRVASEGDMPDLQGTQEEAPAGQVRRQSHCRGTVWGAGVGRAAAQDAGNACGDARAPETPVLTL